MQSQHKKLAQQKEREDPFQIVRNARKNMKRLRSTAEKSRKNSVISFLDQKEKKIRKKERKLTLDLVQNNQKLSDYQDYSQKQMQQQQKQPEILFLNFGEQNLCMQQKIIQEKMEYIWEEKQCQQFYFKDYQGQKGILQGIGDQNSLGKQCDFDFFNPENHRK